MFPGVAEKIVESFVESPIKIESQFCSRFRSSKSSCQRCTEVCPTDVLKISESGVEVGQACIRCGACFSVCPNGVFRLRNEDDRTLASRIMDMLTQNSQALIRFACYQAITEADIFLPCLGRLTENLILVAFRHGAEIVEVHRTECKGCAWEKASSYVEQTLAKARLLAEMTRTMRNDSWCALGMTATPNARVQPRCGAQRSNVGCNPLLCGILASFCHVK